ncbi:MAG: RimK/LysX family protein, partial [Gammaproteobacteria bacterium]
MQRKLSLLLVFLLLFLFVLVPLRADKPPTVNRAGSESAPPEKLILGEAEYVAIPALNTVFAARIDTGAKRSSIYAVDIETFERDGNLWVR